MSSVLLLTSSGQPAAEILPSLSVLEHAVRVVPASAGHVLGELSDEDTPAGETGSVERQPDVIFLDARQDLIRVRPLIGELSGTGIPIIVIVAEGGWAAVSASWDTSDVISRTAGPGELDARIRLAIGRYGRRPETEEASEVRSGDLVIDEATYSAKIRGVALDLTFKEFELLKFLAQHPRRVFTRSQLLLQVWGYDYFGGTRTVDVHVRRLRAKLGSGNEALIGTVRNVGYKFVPARPDPREVPGGRSPGPTQRGVPGGRSPGPTQRLPGGTGRQPVRGRGGNGAAS